jgi:hypothetical protein
MNDLALIRPELSGALTVAEIDATMAYAEAEKALRPEQPTPADWARDFAAWCALAPQPCRRMRASSPTWRDTGRAERADPAQ